MDHFEETLSQETVFKGRVINLRVDQAKLENGNTASREVVEHPGGVCVLAIDEQDQALMVRQFRYPYGRALWELPAGKLDPGEEPAVCGKRELREETGCAAGEFSPFGRLLPSPGYVDEIIHLYLAKDLRTKEQSLDPDEFLTVSRIPLCKAVEMVLSGEIEDAKSQIALLKYAYLQKKPENPQP